MEKSLLIIYCTTLDDCERMFKDFNNQDQWGAISNSLWYVDENIIKYVAWFKNPEFSNINLIRYDRIPQKKE